jgi:transcriptional regulator with XRE-family HTH domain
MSHTIRSSSQQSFAAAVSRVIRESRRRQKLTQAELAHRTGGLVTKAALANYETGHRSLRIDVVWVLAGALGENLGAMMTTAQTYVLPAPTASTEAVIVDVTDLLSRNDPRLAPVRRWFQMHRDRRVTLNHEAIAALASLMGVNEPECRRIICPRSVPQSSHATPTTLIAGT